jgi:hypothetical protein
MIMEVVVVVRVEFEGEAVLPETTTRLPLLDLVNSISRDLYLLAKRTLLRWWLKYLRIW